MTEKYKVLTPPPVAETNPVAPPEARPVKKRKAPTTLKQSKSNPELGSAVVADTLGDRVEKMLGTATFGTFPLTKRRVFVRPPPPSPPVCAVLTCLGAHTLLHTLLHRSSGRSSPTCTRRCGGPQTWTIARHDGPNHLEL